MDGNQSFWQTRWGRFIRWSVFLPISFFLLAILQAIPPLTVLLACQYKPEFNFFVLLVALIVLSILGTFLTFWFMGVFMTPHLTCGLIAPNNKVGSVIFGILFCLIQGLDILILFGRDHSWILLLYRILFAGIVIAGTVVAYKDYS